ncbi:MAG: amidohydrolase family protein [Planctomycetota bacterium]
MAIVLQNALLVDIDPINVEPGCLRIEGSQIIERGPSVSTGVADDTIDCGGAVVLPGLVNGHTHLYSALAAGMPAPPKAPQNFLEILQYIWWRLDRALDAESCTMSARIGSLDALRCGTTTLIDHHASPGFIAGSLDAIEQGIAEVGLRGVLCYETTDRNGPDGRDAGLEENRRYIEKCMRETGKRFAGMVGAHASFTLEDETLEHLSGLADDYGTGVHIHVAEDPCDEEDCQTRFQTYLIDRLNGHKLLRSEAIFAHGTHLEAEAITRISNAGVHVAHNPCSNMNNGVGYAPVRSFGCPIMLGTDGIGSDMFAEARAAWLKSCDEHAGLTPGHVFGMLATSARRASTALDVTLGKLTVEATADVVITDYVPATPLTSENLAGHFFYAMSSRHVKDVIVGGTWTLRDRAVQTCDESRIRAAATKVAANMWDRMTGIE